MELWTTALRPNWPVSAATSKSRSAPSRNRCGLICGGFPKVARFRKSWSPSAASALSFPVKVEQRRRVQGVAHGASSSGQTVFIEPLETIEQNNDLVRLLEDEQAEIHRILLDMTARLGEHADALLQAVEVLAELELQFAKARFAEEYDCVAVKLLGDELGNGSNEGSQTDVSALTLSPVNGAQSTESSDALVLRNARHPLLERTLKPAALP